MARSTSLSILVALGLVAGCGYDENLPSADLTGVVRLPKEAMDILQAVIIVAVALGDARLRGLLAPLARAAKGGA